MAGMGRVRCCTCISFDRVMLRANDRSGLQHHNTPYAAAVPDVRLAATAPPI